MSINPGKEPKEEKEEKNSNLNNQNVGEKQLEPKDTVENYEIETTHSHFNVKEIVEKEQVKTLEKAKDNANKPPNNKSTDYSTDNLKNNEIPIRDSLVELNITNINNENDANKENDNRDNQNQSFMQRTKSWMSNIWTNVKNYNYRNILRKTEMEDVLDAHGNHIKLPKNRKEKILQKKKNNGESNLKYGDINYNTYYISSNVNVFYGYPF